MEDKKIVENFSNEELKLIEKTFGIMAILDKDVRYKSIQAKAKSMMEVIA